MLGRLLIGKARWNFLSAIELLPDNGRGQTCELLSDQQTGNFIGQVSIPRIRVHQLLKAASC